MPVYEIKINKNMKLPTINPIVPPTKSMFKSKSLWLQLITVAAVFFPPVQAFLATNPVEAATVVAAANTVVRFATKGKVSLKD